MEKESKVLVLGSSGMMGHLLTKVIQENGYIVYATDRSRAKRKNYFYLDVLENPYQLKKIIQKVKPKFVINCIGLLVSECLDNPAKAIKINSYFPHYVASLAQESEFMFIHISTDCVFNGSNGPYLENSVKNETNYYGLTKNLGEVTTYKNSLTIRTSIIGPEIRKINTGLFNWFLKSGKNVDGYSNVIWSGLTTLELSKFIFFIMKSKSVLDYNLIHATNNIGINKYNLLMIIKKVFSLKKEINKKFEKESNKQLLNSLDLNYQFQSYENMIIELKSWMILNQNLYNKYKLS
tara:strand:- start:94 stop:972 length:879 start_codon:yes stop_codon:yes gene_type:complete